MSTRFALLPRQHPQQVASQQLLAQLRRHGHAVQLSALPSVPCFQFQLQRADGELRCQVPADAWAERHLHGLHGLDWRQLEGSALAALTAVARPLNFIETSLDYGVARFAGVQEPALDARQLTYPCVDSAEGPVWLTGLDGDLGPSAAELSVSPHLRVPLRLQLASIRLTARRLRRLRAGDIVLLAAPRPTAWRSHRCLFDFDITQEHLTVNTLYPAEDVASDVLPSSTDAPTLQSLDLANLPLTLDVTLCQLDLSLAELAQLQPGSTLELPPQAWQQVRIQHGGHCVATGVLVQVGPTLGVELAQVPRLA